ncbi:LytTR family DNA-binding domain-containing protein [Kordiimonas lacus]|uniref:Transcriptional regulator, LytTR family n=1 Tax=Kordiimonas lacus TaxID=637679 RepID=A0A1G6Y1L8_9PROT|nr:LytTR family DNA-binding domain-containing protein [Kordiimonas lacus]SDD83627.1 transcriptional regulator, LytTR family [Kordiimonas lacus]
MTQDELFAFWGTKVPKIELQKTTMMGACGLILAFIAPYDTSDMPSGLWRVLYWVSLLLLGSVLTGPVARFSFPRIMKYTKSPGLLLAAYAMALSAPVYVTVVAIDIYYHSVRHTGAGPTVDYYIKFLTHEDLSAWDLIIWYFQVSIITFMANAAISMVVHITRPKPAPEQKGPPPGYLFLRRLPAPLGQGLLCLQMEDHYIRAYTDKGDTLVRMRLKDAVAELEGFGGLQVHRSWWVALDMIESVRKDGRRHLIHLKGGMTVPVSKTFEGSLREAGYL